MKVYKFLNGYSKLRISSIKTCGKSALAQSILSVIFCIVYTYIVLILTNGEEFVGKADTYEMINGIRYDFILIMCGVFAALIPIFLLRYDSLKYLFVYIPLSGALYIFLMLLCILFVIDDNFDLIFYALSSVPIGSAVGTLTAIVINLLINKLIQR